MSTSQNEFTNFSSTSLEEDEALAYALCLFNDAGITYNVLNASIELRLFDIIAEAGPGAQLSASEIASKLPTQNPDRTTFFLDRMLRHLASHDLLSFSSRTINGRAERRYGLSLVAKAFVRSKDGASLTSDSSSFGSTTILVETFSHLKSFILEGEGNDIFAKVKGISFYQYAHQDLESSKTFSEAMSAYSKFAMIRILEEYEGFETITSLLDVAGGNGENLNMIVSKYPSIKAINYDLPQVIENASSYPGIEHVGGNMFETIPKSENLMMKDILHNWDDENCLKLLKNCYDALSSTGKLFVMSYVMPEEAESSYAGKHACTLDIVMIMFGGRQRTEREHKALGEAAGFSGFRLSYKCGFNKMGVIEFHK